MAALPPWLVISAGAGVLALLFAVAFAVERRAARGASLARNPGVYALSLGVFVTAWTFYGAVGSAAVRGAEYLALYLGPTLMAALWWILLRRMIRISKAQRITSIADFAAARYGKRASVGALVAVVCLAAMTPYISLQLKAIAMSYNLLTGAGDADLIAPGGPLWKDTTFLIALALAVFVMLFGTRRLDAAERHEGLVAAVALESVIKLAAFAAVGLFVVFGLYGGPGDLFGQALARPELAERFRFADTLPSYYRWFWVTVLSMVAVVLLPRQFQMAVVENVDERHVLRAMWLFPLYLLLITLLVLPVAMAGLLTFGGELIGDAFMVALPLTAGQTWLALVAFIGGLSAATAMIIVDGLALSTMVCNNLLMPLLLRIRPLRLDRREDLSRVLLGLRQFSILLSVLLGYAYFRAGDYARTLAETGLVAFAGIAQLAPAIFIGMFWRRGSARAALAGIGAGLAVWVYTLLIPLLAENGWIASTLVLDGPFGLAWLRPQALLGMSGLDPVAHAMYWSMLFNIGAYALVSLFTSQTPLEQAQAQAFVDVLRPGPDPTPRATWRTRGAAADLHALLSRALGPEAAEGALNAYGAQRPPGKSLALEPELIRYAETLLAGAVGPAAARTMIDTVVHEEPLRDGVTGLPNATSLLSAIGERASRDWNGEPTTLMVLNLDRYRLITSSFGHQLANRLLKEVGERLRHHLPDEAMLARLAGDQFGILLPALDRSAAEQLARRLQLALSMGFRIDDQDVFLTASVGIVAELKDRDPGTALRDAETALARAKDSGLGGLSVFESGMHARALALVRLESDLRRALKQRQFRVYYQPVVELTSGRLCGFEALLRWQRGPDQILPPADFLPLCEQTGMIRPIGGWVLREACRQLAEWQRRFPQAQPLQVSVNLSVKQFMPDLAREVDAALADAGLPAEQLKLEITESVLMEDAQAAAEVLQALHGRRVALLMDDFGTGYSSLSYLRQFPVSTLKIDQSFVRTMEVDRKQAEIVETTIMLAHRLGMDVVAEGVESAGQVARLRELRAEYAQGYYFGFPLAANDAAALVEREMRRSAGR